MMVNNVFVALPKLFAPFIFVSNSYFLREHIYKNGFIRYHENNLLDINSQNNDNIINYISTNNDIYNKIQNKKYLVDIGYSEIKNNLNNDLHTLDIFRNDINFKNDLDKLHKIKLNTDDISYKENNINNYLIYLNYFNSIIEDKEIQDVYEKNDISLLREYLEIIEYYDEIIANILDNKLLSFNYNLNLLISDIDDNNYKSISILVEKEKFKKQNKNNVYFDISKKLVV